MNFAHTNVTSANQMGFLYHRIFSAASRNYAKRQMHWYRLDPSFLWIGVDSKQVKTTSIAQEDVSPNDISDVRIVYSLYCSVCGLFVYQCLNNDIYLYMYICI